MIIRVEARTGQKAPLIIPLDNYDNGLIVENIEGLDPVKATLVSTSFANMDGEQYHSSRREARNIKLTLGLDTGSAAGTVRDLRTWLYGYFMPKTSVTLRFVVASGQAYDIVGRVESCEAPPFTQNPAVVVSFMCFDPDFYDPSPVQISGTTTAGTTPMTIPYSGTVEAGILLSLVPNRTMSEFTIYHKPPNDAIRILEFSTPLISGDVVNINTVPGQKSVYRNRVGANISVLYAVSPQSNWITLEPGPNEFRVYSVGEAIPFTLEYTTRYGGL